MSTKPGPRPDIAATAEPVRVPPATTLVFAEPAPEAVDALRAAEVGFGNGADSRRRLRSLLRAVVALGAELDPQAVLRRVTEAAAELADAQYAALGVLGEDGTVTQFFAIGIDQRDIERMESPPKGEGLLGHLILHPRPLRLDDMSRHPAAVGFPRNHPPMKTFLGVPIKFREQVLGNLYLTEKREGARFDEEDESVVIALASAAGVAIQNARLYEAARRREGWLRAAADVSTHLLSKEEPDDVLTLIARHARTLTGTRAAFVALPVGNRLMIEAADGEAAHTLLGAGMPAFERAGAADQCRAFPTDGRAADLLASAGLGTGLVVPVGPASGRNSGALVVALGAQAAALESSVIAELEAFAGQAGLALELAQRRREAEKLVVFADRDRIGRDLHDLVIQRLFATGMALESTSRLVGPPEAAARVHKAVDDLDATIREIRATIFGLHGSGPEVPTLRARLLDVVDAGADQLGFAPDVRLSGLVDTAVPGKVAEHVVAVLREALSNAARHARARAVDVRIQVDDAVLLTVRDDGCGLPAQSSRRSGLENMADRAHALGGSFSACARESGGTEVIWHVPLSDAAGPPASRPQGREAPHAAALPPQPLGR